MDSFALAAGMFLGGALLGYSIRAVIFIIRKNSLELSVAERLMHAREQATRIVHDAQSKADTILTETREIEKTKDLEWRTTEDLLTVRASLLDERSLELDERTVLLNEKLEALTTQEQMAENLLVERIDALESISGISTHEAKQLLVQQIETLHQSDLQTRVHKLETIGRETLNERAKNILTTAVQRLASSTASELTATTVLIPNEEIKGKIIGKEGRNIRAFERYAGVELLVDEQPGSILVSCFDPVRRAIAVQALQELVTDGRIQPVRIEEEVEKARTTINEIIKEKGSAAVYECGIYNFDPRLVAIIGRLHFRTSYGQNVLQHSIEMAHLASMLASEVGADPYIAKAGALVHDIGKALDHEFEGTHIDIGIKVLRRFNTDERVITAMKSHHDDCPHETLEAVIVQTTDIISGSRPGARRDSAERYLKRLTDIESLVTRFSGVEKAYAIQAGREVRVFVNPDTITDYDTQNLARMIARAIEQELKYPGEIKITIIRETRIIDYAR